MREEMKNFLEIGQAGTSNMRNDAISEIHIRNIAGLKGLFDKFQK